jgi:hypothetical protein
MRAATGSQLLARRRLTLVAFYGARGLDRASAQGARMLLSRTSISANGRFVAFESPAPTWSKTTETTRSISFCAPRRPESEFCGELVDRFDVREMRSVEGE